MGIFGARSLSGEAIRAGTKNLPVGLSTVEPPLFIKRVLHLECRLDENQGYPKRQNGSETLKFPTQDGGN